MAIERRIKTIERENGAARLFIIERDDGCFRFEGEAKVEEDGELYWAPCDISGIYESAEEAERSARKEVLWLRDQTSEQARPTEM